MSARLSHLAQARVRVTAQAREMVGSGSPALARALACSTCSAARRLARSRRRASVLTRRLTALKLFYNTTSGADWTTNTNWDMEATSQCGFVDQSIGKDWPYVAPERASASNCIARGPSLLARAHAAHARNDARHNMRRKRECALKCVRVPSSRAIAGQFRGPTAPSAFGQSLAHGTVRAPSPPLAPRASPHQHRRCRLGVTRTRTHTHRCGTAAVAAPPHAIPAPPRDHLGSVARVRPHPRLTLRAPSRTRTPNDARSQMAWRWLRRSVLRTH